MTLRFAAQPHEGGTDLRDFFRAVANADDLSSLRIIVAWAKRSGLRRASSDLRTVRARGGTIQAIIGVSEGGATCQGLSAMLGETNQTWVFHDAGRTFHPKVYLASSATRAIAFVGSHNFTVGGLSWNYEAGLWCELDLTIDTEKRVYDDIVAYFDLLSSDSASILLTPETLASMLSDGSLVIRDENHRRGQKSQTYDAPEDSDSSEGSTGEAGPRLFPASSILKRPTPKLPPLRYPQEAPARKPAPVSGSIAGNPAQYEIDRRWFKLLNASDAQQKPNRNTNPTGNLRLSQEEFAIDHARYFRQVFFAGLDWAPTQRDLETEEVWVPMQTVIGGDFLGNVNIRVSFALKRSAAQGNVTTVLHWGDLGPRMRGNNYQGDYVTLERSVDGRFNLIVHSSPTGEFLF